VDGSVRKIVDSGGYRHLQVVSGVHLCWLKDSLVAQLILSINALLNLMDVDLRHPGVSINDCDVDIVGVNPVLLEFLFFKIFTTPGHIRGFSFLFKLPDRVMTVTHQTEVFTVFGNERLGLFNRSLLMGLHSKKDQVSFLGLRMNGQMHESFSKKLRILLVAGNDEGVLLLLGRSSGLDVLSIPESCFLIKLILLLISGKLPLLSQLLGLIEQPNSLGCCYDAPDQGLDTLERHHQEDAKTVILICCGEEEGPS
jgi:hypothetical protein